MKVKLSDIIGAIEMTDQDCLPSYRRFRPSKVFTLSIVAMFSCLGIRLQNQIKSTFSL